MTDAGIGARDDMILYAVSPTEREGRNHRIEQALHRMAVGDMSSMEELYELVRADIYAFALSKLRRTADAEDITHDTFVRVWESAPCYVPQGKPMAWILTIAHNLIRRSAVRAQRTVPWEVWCESDTSVDIEGDLVERTFVHELMQTLTPPEQQVIVLHTLSGLKHREIATLLGEPLSTVLSRYNRAIKKLQKKEDASHE